MTPHLSLSANRSYRLGLALLVVCLPLAAEAILPGVKVIRLYPKGRTDYTGCHFGASTALTDRWAVVIESTFGKGCAAHVYEAATGKYLRALRHKPETGVPTFLSVDVQENRALVGMSMPGGLPGKAVLFDLNTGAELMEYAGAAGRTTFGKVVRLQDQFAIIAAPGSTNQPGAVYVHEAATGVFKRVLTAPVQVNGDDFGAALHKLPGTLVVGSPGHDGNAGAVFITNLGTGLTNLNENLGTGVRFGTQICGSGTQLCVASMQSVNILSGRVYPLRLDSVGGGYSAIGVLGKENFARGLLAQDGNLIAAGYDGTAVEFFDASEGLPAEHVHTMEREEVGYSYLTSIQLACGRMLVAAQNDTASGMPQAGTAFLVLGLTTPVDALEVGTTGSWMAGLGNAVARSLHESTVTPDGWPHLISSTIGPDSNGGRDVGLWLGAGTGGERLFVKSRGDYLTLKYGAPGKLLSNNTMHSVYQVSLTGTGVTSLNNRLLCSAKMPDQNAILFRTGSSIPAAGVVSGFAQVAQSDSYDALAASVTFRPGVEGVTPESDTGIVEMNVATGGVNAVIKESATPPGMTDAHGQFLPRVAFSQTAATYVSALRGATSTNQGLFSKRYQMPEVLIARKGASATGVPNAFLSSFLGENSGAFLKVYMRATLTGPGVTSATNEALWIREYDGSGSTLMAQKGSQVSGMAAGVKWLRFLRCAPMRTKSAAVGALIHARIGGPGITAANNEIFFSYQVGGTQAVLLQKGDLAPGCHGARVASFQGIVTASNAHYAMLVGLKGTSSAADQAVLWGNADFGVENSSWGGRRPQLKLRKGSVLAAGYNVSSRITSLSFPNPNLTDTTGFLNKGLANVLGVHTSGNTTTVSLQVKAGFGSLGSAVIRLQ
jgi:hypothetical protein